MKKAKPKLAARKPAKKEPEFVPGPTETIGNPCEARIYLRGYGYSEHEITLELQRCEKLRETNWLKSLRKMADEAEYLRRTEETLKRMQDETRQSSSTSTAKPLEVKNETSVAVKATEGDGGGRRYSVYGHNVTSVLRWMGADAWTFQQAQKAMAKLGLPVADATLRAQLRAGVIGTRGEPAKLSAKEIEDLYSLIEDEPCPSKTSPPSTSRSAPAAVAAKPHKSSSSVRSSSAPAKPAKRGTTSKSQKKNPKASKKLKSKR